MVTIQPASARQPELATTPVNPAHLFGEVGPSRVHASISLPAPGNQAYRVTVTDVASGAPRTDIQKVFMTFAPPPDTDVPAQRVELAPDPLPGLYVANGAYTPLVGEWDVEVIVRREGERDETISFEVPVSSPGAATLGPPADTGVGVPIAIAATWRVIPGGLLGWLPAASAFVLLALMGRIKASRGRSIARGAAVAILVVAVAAAGTRTLVDVANTPGAAELAAQPALAADASVSRGEPIYRANCSSCHGLGGEGDGPVTTHPAPGSLADAVEGASDAELSYRISYGVAGMPMPAFAGLLTDEERADLIAYLRVIATDR
jgi:mono/diheme cytochrome c family protein